MVIIGKLFSTFVLMVGLIWAFFPGGFGVINFIENRSKVVVLVAYTIWGLLMLAHLLAAYRIWFSNDKAYIWLISIIVMHIIFFATIATDVSTK